MGYVILFVFAVIYIVLLYNFPVITIIVTAIFLIGWFSDGDNKGKKNRPDRWINGYYKKDGTFVEGHWKRKR